MSAPASATAELRRWERFTPLQRTGRFAAYLLMVAAVVWSLDTIEIIPEFLYDAPEQTWDLFQRMWPFDWAYYPQAVQGALIETFHMATLGTLLALVIAVPVALMGARNITPVPVLNWLATVVFVASRSVNSLIWALLFVAVFGPGPLAGTLAIAFRSVGFLGKLLSEALEEAQPGPIEALTALGAPRAHLLLKGYWPQVEPGFWGIVLLRWDINIRESSVLGLVGAGGIGMALDAAMSNLYWDQAGLILAIILVVVLAIETLTTLIRRRII